MRHLTLGLLFLLLVTFIIRAQDSYLLAGKVVDATTQQSIPFAIVTLKGTLTGTSANANGKFF
ncbi:carboxypeptidase-like regulatory domain-containing protein [Adhaeribacter swui]|uniref:Carboxypeptidase-like regulatory domain-containing protein n=1 Tax=Adhaeribacter swui TaxID=2086471 RepID=A0A7G7GAM5_9BACT|nr:carboxypeptidase-like regulatory domain-containing protein [Adhaeribacter swui]QNF34209.1 carboxypeptidase-like regulatory domain-containing protein [Adhaeribacter swui]